MTKIYYYVLICLLVIGSFSGNALAQKTDIKLTLLSEVMDNTHQQPAFSPREFCRSTGGKVSETNHEHIYLCCYVEKQKCVVSNTEHSLSWSIPYHSQTHKQRQISNGISQNILKNTIF